MKVFNRFILAGLMIAGTAIGAEAQAQASDAFSETLMKAYTSVLNEDPHDWEALFRRANEYYRRDDYVKALADIDLAIKYIPESETDMQAQAYSLRGNIQMMSHRYEKALADFNEVLTLIPGDYPTIYQRATALYNLERYPEAKTDFKIMQQMNSRSLEAIFGLARIAVKENNLGTANELIDQALTLSPNNSEVYIRRADVHTMMGNPQGAVEDYIMAISSDDQNTGRALAQLVKLSRADYPVVIAGLSNAIRQAPQNGMFYYIRAMIAQGHCNYTAAIDDYNKIIEGHLDSYPGINAALAECYYALGEYEKAMLNVDYAVNAAPENADYNILKSNILLALNEPENALASADKAVEINPDLNAAIIARANALIALKNYTEASVALSEAAMNNPEDPALYIVRGWVLEKFRDNAKSGKASYERVLDMDYDFDNIRSLRGFALMALDRADDGRRWINKILSTVEDYDGLVNYYGACFFAWDGNLDKAFACMEKSLEKGYANFHAWTRASDANLNVEPLRNDPRFSALLAKYSRIFK